MGQFSRAGMNQARWDGRRCGTVGSRAMGCQDEGGQSDWKSKGGRNAAKNKKRISL